jgi:hypothetical protein
MRSLIVAWLLLLVGCSSSPSTTTKPTAPTDPAEALRDAVLAHLPTGPYQTTLRSTFMGKSVVATHHTDPPRARMLVVLQVLPDLLTTTARYDGKRVVVVTKNGEQTVTMAATQQAFGEPFAWGVNVYGAMIQGSDLVHGLRNLLQDGQPVLGAPSTVDNEVLQTLRIIASPEQVFARMVTEHTPDLINLDMHKDELLPVLVKDAAVPMVLSIDANFHVRRIQYDVAHTDISLAPLTPSTGPSDAELITPAEQMRTIVDLDASLQETRQKVDALLTDKARMQALRAAYIAAWPKPTP